jgi:hypothetical protein
MKTLVFLSALLVFATSCDVYYVDPTPVVVYDERDAFVGSYDLNEYSSTYDEYWEYGISIYKSSGGQIMIDNFYNSGLRVYADVSGTSLYIPWQTVNGYEIKGDGFVEGSKITINYKVRDTYTQGAAWDFCNATGWL